MSDGGLSAVSELLGILTRGHPNVLLIGPESATAHALDRIQVHLHLPIEAWSPADARALPNGQAGTLLIPSIDKADDDQQSQLSAWLDSRLGLVQVVALSVAPLFPLVERGIFLAQLYYRLNQICVDLTGVQES